MGWGAVVEPRFCGNPAGDLSPAARPEADRSSEGTSVGSDLESISDALVALSHSIFTMDAVASGTSFPLKCNCSNFLPKQLSAHYIFSKALDLKHLFRCLRVCPWR